MFEGMGREFLVLNDQDFRSIENGIDLLSQEEIDWWLSFQEQMLNYRNPVVRKELIQMIEGYHVSHRFDVSIISHKLMQFYELNSDFVLGRKYSSFRLYFMLEVFDDFYEERKSLTISIDKESLADCFDYIFDYINGRKSSAHSSSGVLVSLFTALTYCINALVWKSMIPSIDHRSSKGVWDDSLLASEKYRKMGEYVFKGSGFFRLMYEDFKGELEPMVKRLLSDDLEREPYEIYLDDPRNDSFREDGNYVAAGLKGLGQGALVYFDEDTDMSLPGSGPVVKAYRPPNACLMRWNLEAFFFAISAFYSEDTMCEIRRWIGLLEDKKHPEANRIRLWLEYLSRLLQNDDACFESSAYVEYIEKHVAGLGFESTIKDVIARRLSVVSEQNPCGEIEMPGSEMPMIFMDPDLSLTSS